MEEFVDGPPAWREWQGQRWYYSVKMRRYRSATGLMLAHAVWGHYRGAVPPGFDVHHLNEDCSDDRLENLSVVESHEHRRAHAKVNSALGVEANRRLGHPGATKMWENRLPQRRVCTVCREEYETRSTYSSYCGKRCSTQARIRRQRAKFGLQ